MMPAPASLRDLKPDIAELGATADSAILDRCRGWFNLGRETIAAGVPQARVVDPS
jgi:hypothetical protein